MHTFSLLCPALSHFWSPLIHQWMLCSQYPIAYLSAELGAEEGQLSLLATHGATISSFSKLDPRKNLLEQRVWSQGNKQTNKSVEIAREVF